jgi:hypothetical protein
MGLASARIVARGVIDKTVTKVVQAGTIEWDISRPSQNCKEAIADPGTEGLVEWKIRAAWVGVALGGVEIDEFKESAPECPGLVVRFGLVGRKSNALRLGTLAFPNTGKNTCTGGTANVREALDLKVKTTVIELV